MTTSTPQTTPALSLALDDLRAKLPAPIRTIELQEEVVDGSPRLMLYYGIDTAEAANPGCFDLILSFLEKATLELTARTGKSTTCVPVANFSL